jgi:hypothetical protein
MQRRGGSAAAAAINVRKITVVAPCSRAGRELPRYPTVEQIVLGANHEKTCMIDPANSASNTQSAAPAKGSKGRGIVQVVLGVFLIGLMGTITMRMGPMLLAAPDALPDGTRFNASHGAARLVLALFAAVMLFGAVTIAHGVSLARSGVKPRKLLYLQWAAAVLILILVALVMLTIR